MRRTAKLSLSVAEQRLGVLAYAAAASRVAVRYVTEMGLVCVTMPSGDVPAFVRRVAACRYRLCGCVRL